MSGSGCAVTGRAPPERAFNPPQAPQPGHARLFDDILTGAEKFKNGAECSIWDEGVAARGECGGKVPQANCRAVFIP